MSDISGISDEQLTELIELVRRIHGFDFGEYSKASLKRRLSRIVMLKKLSFADLSRQLYNEPQFFQWFLEEITVNVTEMFRDPVFFKALYAQVVPYLKDQKYIRV